MVITSRYVLVINHWPSLHQETNQRHCSVIELTKGLKMWTKNIFLEFLFFISLSLPTTFINLSISSLGDALNQSNVVAVLTMKVFRSQMKNNRSSKEWYLKGRVFLWLRMENRLFNPQVQIQKPLLSAARSMKRNTLVNEIYTWMLDRELD